MMPVAIETAGYTRAPFTLHSRSADSIERLTTACVRIRADADAPNEFALFSLCKLKVAAIFLLERDGLANPDGSMMDAAAAPTLETCNPATGR